jgi:demethylmenaquinone methyltransferase/2-methoxy-6-polyprenyl-1,4-benzoquinol methylase
MKTDFGFADVPPAEKTRRVRSVFDSVAPHYDLMNDLMSFGLHRLWKRYAVLLAGLRRGQRVLDLAGGTGDLARLILREVAPEGEVVLADINVAMLARGRDRLFDRGLARGIHYVQADAERLPFAPCSFHCVTVAFGLRNVTDKDAALRSIHSVLRFGGRLVVLEFSPRVLAGFEPLYDFYSFTWLPWLGQRVASDAASYRYLAESIRRHPDPDRFAAMLEAAGFARVSYHNLAGGIVALHRAHKI